MEPVNPLFEIYKKVFSMPRKDKEILFANLRDLKSKANALGTVRYASGAHDPETVEDVRALVEALEKHVGLDGDLSYGKISLFLHPLSLAVRRRLLRPCQIVSLVGRMSHLAREFQRELPEKNHSILHSIRRDFNSDLREIKKRLAAPDKAGGFKLEKSAAIGHNDLAMDALVANLVSTSRLRYSEAVSIAKTAMGANQ